MDGGISGDVSFPTSARQPGRGVMFARGDRRSGVVGRVAHDAVQTKIDNDGRSECFSIGMAGAFVPVSTYRAPQGAPKLLLFEARAVN